MRALVTGGAGFIGTNLIKRLLKDGHEVTSFDNYSTGYKENEQDGCHYIHAGVQDIKFWGRRLEKQDKIPDIIFHMAALPRIGPSFKNPKEVMETNVMGTLNVLEYARKNDIPVIYGGSSSFHGGVYKNPYTFSKWQGEELCKMYSDIFDVSTSICRFYNVYGDYMQNEGEYRTVLSIFLEQYRGDNTFTITGDGTQKRDFTHVDDVVEGMIRVMRAMHGEVDMRYSGEIFEFGRGRNYSIKEVVKMFPSPRWTFIPEIPGEVKETLCNDERTKEILGWKPKVNLNEWLEKQL